MIKILFVCTGNVFRSMVAEKCLKHYLMKNNIKDIKADSAGIRPKLQEPQAATIERLFFYNIKVHHKYKKITKKLVEDNDAIIAMNVNHQKYIEKKFGIKAPLFNEVAYDKKEGVLDIAEYNPDFDKPLNRKEMEKYICTIVDYIYTAVPKLVKNIHKWI